MSISSIYTGMSGIQSMSDAMSCVGHNISNLETAGYRSRTVSFHDLFSESVSGNGSLQTGYGSTTGAVTNDFSTGNVEPTSSALDLAISGKGFFVVKQGTYDNAGNLGVSPDADICYTRAFHFNIDKDGYLVDANGNVAQGWAYVEDEFPSLDPTDIQFDLEQDTYSADQVTSRLTLISNLDSEAADKSAGPGGLSDNWDATADVPMSSTAHNLMASQQIFDNEGAKGIDTYFDKTADANTWEYLITHTPSAPGAPDDGLLARGTITFANGTGLIADITMEQYSGGAWVAQSADDDTVNGYFQFPTPLGNGSVEFDIGTTYTNGTWTNDSRTTTQYSSSTCVSFQTADGFDPESSLVSVMVDASGVIVGTYSDGHQSQLSRLALAAFRNPYGLEPTGKSLFAATDASGGPDFFTAGPRSDEYSNTATIASYALEGSNVELTHEMSNMIMIQRGLQASSKGLSSADQMMQTAINMVK